MPAPPLFLYFMFLCLSDFGESFVFLDLKEMKTRQCYSCYLLKFMLLNVTSNSLSTALISGLNPFYLALKTCVILVFLRSFALETQMEGR